MSHYRPWAPHVPPPPVRVNTRVGLDPALTLLSPAAAVQQMTGLGQTQSQGTALGAGVSVGVGLLLLGVTGALSYFAGAAMAPSRSDRKTWGIVGVPVGMLTGPWGLGVMGIVATRK